MLWHGGASYAPGELPADLEDFGTLRELKRAFDSRADSSNTYYPCVEREPQDDGGQFAWVYLCPSSEVGPDFYPDRVLTYGPRGGLRLEYA